MRGWIALAPLLLLVGCGPAGIATPTGLSSVAAALEAVGSTATGFKTTLSTAELNGADKGLVEAQTAMTQTQLEQSHDDRQRLAQERVVTARLLRGMSTDYHEPVFLTLAAWVEAGGDPDFAFKYALAHISEGQTKELPQQAKDLPQQAMLVAAPTQTSQILTTSAQSDRKQTSTGASEQTRPLNDGKVDEVLDQVSLYQGLMFY